MYNDFLLRAVLKLRSVLISLLSVSSGTKLLSEKCRGTTTTLLRRRDSLSNSYQLGLLEITVQDDDVRVSCSL